MYWPSGVQYGLLSRRKSSFDTWVAPLPSAFMRQRLLPPPRSEVKAISLPSGEKRGWMSQAGPLVRRLAWPPAAGSS